MDYLGFSLICFSTDDEDKNWNRALTQTTKRVRIGTITPAIPLGGLNGTERWVHPSYWMKQRVDHDLQVTVAGLSESFLFDTDGKGDVFDPEEGKYQKPTLLRVLEQSPISILTQPDGA